MTTPAAPAPVTDPSNASTDEVTTPSPTTPPVEPVAPATQPALGDTLPDDPDTLKAEITKLRRENGAARTAAKKNAADEARADLAQTIGRALGLVEDEPLDPAKLTEQLTASNAAAKQAQVELAIFHAAAGVNANATKLLDSRSFMARVADVDPTDHLAIAAAIGEAVSSDPSLAQAAGDTPRLPAPNRAQGSSASGPASGPAQLTKADVERLAREGKHVEIEQARKDGRLNDVLGIKP